MAWERRGSDDKRGYYYRAARVGGQVVKSYVGAGEAARQAASEDAARRAEREELRLRLAAAAAAVAAAESSARLLERECGIIAEAVLLALGFRRQRRHRWRKWRAGREAIAGGRAVGP